jgi:hypothetical protein
MKKKYTYSFGASNDTHRVSDNYPGDTQHSVLSHTSAFPLCRLAKRNQVLSTGIIFILTELIIVMSRLTYASLSQRSRKFQGQVTEGM